MATDFYEYLGKRLQEIREKKNISRDALGKKLGITRQAIFNYETGNREISAVNYLKFCQACDYDPDKLMKEMISKLK